MCSADVGVEMTGANTLEHGFFLAVIVGTNLGMAQHALHASPSTESWSIGKSKIDFVHSEGGELLARSLLADIFH
jgi:hypothetical protein